MRISKASGGEGGGRNERRRSRERAREARRRREEIEKRAAEAAQANTKTSGDGRPKASNSKSGPEGKDKPKSRSNSAKRRQRRPVKAVRERSRTLAASIAGGGREAGRRLAVPTLTAAGRRVATIFLRALRLLGFGLFWLLARLDRIRAAVTQAVTKPLSAVVGWLDRAVTPSRTAIAVATLAGLAAVAAQGLDYRAIAIGEAAYADVASLTQAPLTGHETPWTAHGPLVGLLAIVSAVGGILALRGGGRRAMLLALGPAGLALLVILAIDLPRARDLGEAVDEYAGTASVLLEGFYIELAAVVLLAVVALLPTVWRLPGPSGSSMLGRLRRPGVRTSPRQSPISGEKRRTV